MCLKPITIPNQSKYISLRHKDKFLMDIPCGQCAECQQTMSNQWYYRAWYEWQDLALFNGYCLFDCLTYNDASLPHLSDFWSMLDPKDDYPCFNPLHIRHFLQTLRQRLIRAGYSKDAFRYFLSTEYGTDDRFTHRPHIHIMLYVKDCRIDPLWLSRLVADVWKHGRTDGLSYKSASYILSHNYIPAVGGSLGSKLRTCHYVTKYVQKSCQFQKELDKRLHRVMWSLANYADPVTPDKWLDSEQARRERLKLLRYVNQFHRQSQHFGESALADLDINQLFDDGCLYMPDTQGVKIPIPLPTYYKRKLFQEQISFNGSRYWQTTALGKEYKDYRASITLQSLIDRYECINVQNLLGIKDIPELADYVYNKRGRILGDLPESTISERYDKIDLINYSSGSDKLNFGCRGLTAKWLGDSQQGYNTTHLFGRITLSDFISKHVYFDAHFEYELDLIKSKMMVTNNDKQAAFEIKQRLTNLYKPLLI